MKYAAIDIGTNTLRLLIAEADSSGRLSPLVYRRAITRLGGSYTESAGIDPMSAQRTFAALEEFKRVIDEVGVESVEAAATSVVRRAGNKKWFLSEIEKKTGISVSVISGEEEARLSLLGVLSVLNDPRGCDTPRGRRLVMDIGGGSTEFIATDDGGIRGVWSMEMGVVHLTETHLKSDPPQDAEIKALRGEIGAVMGELKAGMANAGVNPADYSMASGAVFVGTAGTVTTLAALDQGLEVYDRTRINNATLSRPRVERLYRYLVGLTLRERQTVLNLEKGREDLIISGALIAIAAMDEFGFEEIKVSDAGLLEGIVIKKNSGRVAPSQREVEAKARKAEV
ncbi:MAG: exopolyphosphatase [Deltaproteobacteria bacterium]|nr:exopolyphosphatase [Deltaproteobacteria bacterium]